MSDETVVSVVSVGDLWHEVKALVEAADVDVLKNVKGNASAGVRARKALRLLKKKVGDLVKATVEADKAAKS